MFELNYFVPNCSLSTTQGTASSYLVKYKFGSFLWLAGVRYSCVVESKQRLNNDLLIKSHLKHNYM